MNNIYFVYLQTKTIFIWHMFILGCAKLAAPSNGLVTYPIGTTYRSVARFSCQPGYTLVGVVERTCMEDKSWNGTYPVCEINSMKFNKYLLVFASNDIISDHKNTFHCKLMLIIYLRVCV